VFSAQFRDFLSTGQTKEASERAAQSEQRTAMAHDGSPTPNYWYDGGWTERRGERWRQHNFYVPVDRQRVATPEPAEPVKPDRRCDETAAMNVQGQMLAATMAPTAVPTRYKVFGTTAHVLVDAARVAFGRAPEQEHSNHLGDEALIEREALGWDWLRAEGEVRGNI